MFDKLTPQFEKYFNEIFKQVAGVLDQGVNYYNLKLAKEADIHKEALSQIVEETFKATEDIVRIGQKEQTISQQTEQHLQRIFEAKRKWARTTHEFDEKDKEVASPTAQRSSEPKQESKVFVRADLNYPTSHTEG